MDLSNIKNMGGEAMENTPVPKELLEKYFIDPDQHIDRDLSAWLKIRCACSDSKPTKEEALAYMRVWPRDCRYPPESVQNAISPPKTKKK